MIFPILFAEFFRVGLFAVGGGLATIPFLSDLGARTGWFSPLELANMIAVSESTPGPIGVKMAAYVGLLRSGIPGAIVATLGLVAPSLIINLIIARFLEQYRENRIVDSVFDALRPASAALIAAALVPLARLSLTVGGWAHPNLPALGIAAAVFLCLQIKPLKRLHPVVFLALSALAGLLLL